MRVDTSGHGSGRRRPRNPGQRAPWTVRAHLAAVLVVVLAVFCGLGSVVAVTTLRKGERNVRETAAGLAGLAADAIGEGIATAGAQAETIAANPAALELIRAPADCPLEFNLDLFPGSRLDLVTADGRVACTSSTDLVTGRYDDLSVLRVGQVRADPVDGAPAAVVGVPVADEGGTPVGGVIAVLPLGQVPVALHETFGGPRGYEFAVVDTSSSSVLASSDAPATAKDRAKPFEGAGDLVVSEPVEGSDLAVVSGLPDGRGLGPARSVVLRGGLVAGAVLLVLLAALAVLYRRIARPLRLLTDAVGDVGPHRDAVVGRVDGPREVVQLAEEFRRAIAAHESFETQLSHQALHDPLTGLANRVLLAERLGHSLEQAAIAPRTIAVLFLDLDRFKLVNDGLGHAVGDQVLIRTAERLAAVLRPGDTLARFGGDEFVVVGDGFEDDAGVTELADRMLAAVAEPSEIGDVTVRVAASIGIAVADRTSSTGDLLRDADTAMYAAKERGGARWKRFDHDLRTRVTSRLALESELRTAQERGQLYLVYQPKLDLLTGETAGVEALLRWDHPTLGTVSPADFIPVAEETALIVPIGRFVLREACRQAARWRDEGLDVAVSVNVSARQVAEPSLVDDVAAALADTGLPPDRLCLELTESVLVYDTVTAAGALARLHALGIEVSIDDFGTGYSSLAYLHRFPVDELKIDRVFVQALTERGAADHHGLVSAMVAIGSALGLRIVAEGVETHEQAERLLNLGCGVAQGFLYASPQRPEALAGYLRATAPRPVTAS